MLLETHSLDELVQHRVISRAPKYNYIKTLEKVELKTN